MTAQEIYDAAIANGTSPRLAEMFACRKAPGANTDREFFVGQKQLCDQFTPIMLDKYVKQARKAGYNPSPNDVYLGQLARFPGDPEAFVSPSGGRSQIKKVLEQRGWGCTGAVNVQRRDEAPDEKATGLASDLVEDFVKQEIAADPGKAFVDKRELREQIIDRHGSK